MKDQKKEQEELGIKIYETADQQIKLDVKLDGDTIWLTQRQMSLLFDKDPNTIGEHIRNVYSEGELDEIPTTRKFRVVQIEGGREVYRELNHYNLDVVISVGYRVKSLRGTAFRIWATSVLKDHLVQGYTINQKRLEATTENLQKLQKQIEIMSRVQKNEQIGTDEAQGLINLISDYSESLKLIQKYDDKAISKPQSLNVASAVELDYEELKREIDKLREKLSAGHLFGNERESAFESVLRSVFQTFSGKDLYPSLEEKAGNLLYLIIKNHPFSDGNKRIGSFVFLRFLDINGMLYRPDGTRLVAENALVAIALMVAQSDPAEKSLMVDLVVNLLVKSSGV